jgi:TPR repeat protein
MVDQYENARNLMAGHQVSKAPKAYALLEIAMKKGDHRAAYAIGTWYLHGFYLKKDVKRGVSLIAKAADNEVADAAFDLAVCYELGTGKKANDNKALCYYMRSFLLGYSAAAIEIERLLYWGDTSVRNRSLSREFKDAYLRQVNCE